MDTALGIGSASVSERKVQHRRVSALQVFKHATANPPAILLRADLIDAAASVAVGLKLLSEVVLREKHNPLFDPLRIRRRLLKVLDEPVMVVPAE